MSDSVPTEPRHTLLDRFLGLFTDVRPGESVTALLMLANIFTIFVSYAIIKVIREPLILTGGGAEVKSYSAAFQAVLLMGFIPLYSWFSSRVSRMRLIVGVTIFFAVNIQLFSLAVSADVAGVGIAFYVWTGIFSLVVGTQFWSYANDIYPKNVGDRLFPIIVIGMTAGNPLGSKIAGVLFAEGTQAQSIMHISTALLLLTLAFYWLVDRREAGGAGQAQASEALGEGNGFMLVFKSKYLRMVALLIVVLNLVNTNGEYIIGKLVTAQSEAQTVMDAGAFIGAFYGNYYFWVNVITLLIQAFVVSRIVKYLGFGGVLLALPIVAFGAYTAIAAGIAFSLIRWAKTAENSTDYSVMNTARQLLWLPTTREEKYKAKQAIDVFFTRLGDVVSAIVVFVGTTMLAFDYKGFAVLNIVVVLFWFALGVMIVRENRRLVALQEEREAA